MKLIQTIKILSVGATLSFSAHAENITYQFSGHMVDAFGNYDAGTPFTGTFSYVRPQINQMYDPNDPFTSTYRGRYDYSSFRFQVGDVITGYNTVSDTNGYTWVYDNASYVEDYFQMSPSDHKSFGNFGGVTLNYFDFVLQDFTGTVFNNGSLPGQGMTGTDFNQGIHNAEASFLQLRHDPLGPFDTSMPVYARGLLDFLGPVNMPLGFDTSIYRFNVENVTPNTLTFIDPVVAVGYDYAIGAGDPNFASVLLPNIGDGQFMIEYLNGEELVQLALAADTPFYFPDGGVSDFKVRGIETTAALDPDDTNAFITGLSFASAGNFTGTMTPVTVETAPVPLPSGLILFVSGILGMLPSRLPRGKNKQQFQTVTS